MASILNRNECRKLGGLLSPAQKRTLHLIAQIKLKKLSALLELILESSKRGRVNDRFYKKKLLEAYDIMNPPK